MILLWLTAGVLGQSSEAPPVVTPAGGGSIIRTYETRRRLSDELETALAAMRRPQARAKRKKALATATGALRDLVAAIKALPPRDVPVAARDLELTLARGIEVETGAITFADWRGMIAHRIAQAQAEIEATRIMVEEEEAAMFMLMAA
jgi:hypothetical protein